VLRAAVKVADGQGLDSLSMRKLGDALGVEAMSLYNYVSSKDDLLDGMADVVSSEIGLPADDADWRSVMRQWAISVREVLNRHRWAVRLLGARVSPGPTTLALYDAVFRCLRTAGFSVELAGTTFGMLNSYAIGFAVQQATVPFETGAEAAAHTKAVLEHSSAEEYPHLREILHRLVEERTDPLARFENGLDLILDAIEQRFEGAND
jgi:AcrR family transcriptional regulator